MYIIDQRFGMRAREVRSDLIEFFKRGALLLSFDLIREFILLLHRIAEYVGKIKKSGEPNNS